MSPLGDSRPATANVDNMGTIEGSLNVGLNMRTHAKETLPNRTHPTHRAMRSAMTHRGDPV